MNEVSVFCETISTGSSLVPRKAANGKRYYKDQVPVVSHHKFNIKWSYSFNKYRLYLKKNGRIVETDSPLVFDTWKEVNAAAKTWLKWYKYYTPGSYDDVNTLAEAA